MLYSRPYIEQRIKEEKFRTCRTGSPFSMVLFNPFKLISQNNKGRKKAIKAITKILDQNTREPDIKGWWNKNTIAVLLLDTLPEGALSFVDKLSSTIQANCQRMPQSSDQSNFKIYTFPSSLQVQSNMKDKSGKDPNQKHQGFNSLTYLEVQDFSAFNGLKKYQGLIRRILDIIFSATGLIFLSPVFLLCILLIKLDSPGPVLYKQKRVGQGGTSFSFLKFRTMYHDCDESVHENHVKNLVDHTAGLLCNGRIGERSYKLIEDHRVTRFGKFLRETSVDELPQLFNVLKGDMTLVGPRPHPVYEAALYNQWWKYRLDVKPGVTGLGQIDGRYNRGYEEVYRLDLQYLKRASLFLDLKILFKTIPVVLSRNGAC